MSSYQNATANQNPRRLFEVLRETGERVCGERIVVERLPQYFWVCLTMLTTRTLEREMGSDFEKWQAGCLILSDN